MLLRHLRVGSPVPRHIGRPLILPIGVPRCAGCYDRATRSKPAARPTTLVVPDERIVGDAKLVDSERGGGAPIGNLKIAVLGGGESGERNWEWWMVLQRTYMVHRGMHLPGDMPRHVSR